MKRILILLVIIAVGLLLTMKSSNRILKFEEEHYHQSYHQEALYGSEVCIIPLSENHELTDISDVNSYGLFNVSENTPEYMYQIHERVHPASTTKILTALVALENADLDDSVTVSKNACSTSFAWDEQVCGIKEGDVISLKDLLYGLLLYSGNDTAVAIAEHVGGSVESFAEMMNEKAKQLLATHSHFMNPSGLEHEDHYTTAYDLYLIFNECIKNETFLEIINTDSYTAEVTNEKDNATRELTWEVTHFYATKAAKAPENVTVIGGKTGTLLSAGNCLILLSEDSSKNPYISIVMGALTKELLYQDMTTILENIS